jgi:hypothetical protein
MNDLSPEAQAIVDAGRGDLPPEGHRDRIKKSVLLRAAAATLAASSASSSVAAGTAVATASSAKLTTLMVAIGLGAATIAGVAAWRGSHRAAEIAPAPPPAAPVANSVPTETAAIEAPAAEVPVAEKPVARAATPSNARPAEAASSTSSRASLESEVALLRGAQDALRDGQPARALEVLDEHARQFPHGALTQERRAIRAIALCQAKPGAAARAQAEAFLRSAPSSPLVERVRAACGR